LIRGRGHQDPASGTVARQAPDPPTTVSSWVGIVHVLRLVSEGT